MHTVVFTIATVWMTVLLAVSVAALIRARSTITRILTLDMITLILVALLVLFADSERTSYFLDAALVLALLGVVATIAAARYYSRRRPLS